MEAPVETQQSNEKKTHVDLDAAISQLEKGRASWAKTTNAERIQVLEDIKVQLMPVSAKWVEVAAQKKMIPEGSPLVGEEWMSGPYALMSACNQLINTLTHLKNKQHIKDLPVRRLANGQTAVRVVPGSVWDRLLLSGVEADVWMQKDVTPENLAEHTASTYDIPVDKREPGISLVLGAGNIAAIAPLDVLQKAFVEHKVVILKMNPVNDYLTEPLREALKPLIDANALRIVKGGADVGQYLCNHPEVSDIHITGAEATHDAIIWGTGDEALANKKANTPKNTRPISSELGGVSPTIIVPGPWSKSDVAFQAENVATQKLHNAGFNCIACQALIMPENWEQGDSFITAVEDTIANAPTRGLYYPGAEKRLASFREKAASHQSVSRGDYDAVIAPVDADDDYFRNTEVFAPAMSTVKITGNNAETYLRNAIAYANDKLHGTLGANIIIHPKTIDEIGKGRFEEIIADLHYGCIAINAWTGLGFLSAQTPWGAFPGHTLDNVQSGIGFVHNTYLFDKPERAVIKAPWQPFPRNVLSGGMTMLPRPPWFVTNKRADKIGKLLTEFQHKPGWQKLPLIFWHALQG